MVHNTLFDQSAELAASWLLVELSLKSPSLLQKAVAFDCLSVGTCTRHKVYIYSTSSFEF